MAEALALHGPGFPHVHRVPGPGKPGGGPAGGRRRGVPAAMAAHVGDGHGRADAAALRAARRGHGEAPRRALPRGVPDLGHARALGHDGARARRRRHTGGDWQRDCHQDPLGGHRAALGWRRHHRARLVSSFALVVCGYGFVFLLSVLNPQSPVDYCPCPKSLNWPAFFLFRGFDE